MRVVVEQMVGELSPAQFPHEYPCTLAALDRELQLRAGADALQDLSRPDLAEVQMGGEAGGAGSGRQIPLFGITVDRLIEELGQPFQGA